MKKPNVTKRPKDSALNTASLTLLDENQKPVVKVKGLSQNVKIKDVKFFFQPIHVKDVKILKNGVALVHLQNADDVKTALGKTGAIKNKQVRVRPYQPKSTDVKDGEKEAAKELKQWPAKPQEGIIEEILETGRLFLRNLSFDCKEDELQALFSPFGTLTEVYVAYDNSLKSTKGFGFVQFMFPKHAAQAYKALDKTRFKNRLLHILPGLAKPATETQKGILGDTSSAAHPSSFKRQRDSERKATAHTGHNWNALFINPDAVATYISQKHGVAKEDLFDTKSKDSVAVRLAHGETRLVLEMREFLLRQGVRLDVLEAWSAASAEVGSGQRHRSDATNPTAPRQLSGTTFLVKNLPAGVTEEELRPLFSKFHGLTRLILPPLGVTAIVEYGVPQQAKAAYSATAYQMFKDNVLMLQWAPIGIIGEPKQDEDQSGTVEEAANSKPSKRRKRSAASPERTSATEEVTSSGEPPAVTDQDESRSTLPPNQVLLVRNVPFQVKLTELIKLFQPLTGLVRVRLPKKPIGGHRGFGFVEFETVNDAKVAMETLGVDTHLLGRRLRIEYAKANSGP